VHKRPTTGLTASSVRSTPPAIEDTPDGVRVWCKPAGGRETWECTVRRDAPVTDLVVRLAWDLRLPVDAAELLASEVLVRLASPAPPAAEGGQLEVSGG
jgi:hypothetical protein